MSRAVLLMLRPLVLAAVAACLSGTAIASERVAKGVKPFDAANETVELFAGIEAGKLAVQVIPRDATECKLLITNKGDKPLNVRMPEVLAALPALAQFPPAPLVPNPNRRQPREPRDNTPQPLAMPMPTMLNPMNRQPNNVFPNVPNNNPFNRLNNNPFNRMNNQRNPWALFSIPAEKVGTLELPGLCLAHGKPNPKPTVPYVLKPIETLAPSGEVQEVCRMMGRGEIERRVAQAAVWHLQNEMSWKELAAKKADRRPAPPQPYFTKGELEAAKKAVEKAAEAAKQPPKTAQASSGR